MSRVLDLDFIKTSLFSISDCNWLGVIVFIASILFAIVTVNQYQNISLVLRDSEEKFKESQVLKDKVSTVKHINNIEAVSALEIKHINEVIQTLVVPWDDLFVSIESASTPEIALLRLEPNLSKKQVQIGGEAKNYEAILSYIKQLKKQPNFKNIYLTEHSVNQVDVSKPVSFTVLATWLYTN